MLDQVAYACAARYSGHYAVTLSVDMVLFKNPVKIGSLVTFSCFSKLHRTNIYGNRYKSYIRRYKDHTMKNTNVCYFTMIAVDEDGKPVPVPKLELITEDDKKKI